MGIRLIKHPEDSRPARDCGRRAPLGRRIRENTLGARRLITRMVSCSWLAPLAWLLARLGAARLWYSADSCSNVNMPRARLPLRFATLDTSHVRPRFAPALVPARDSSYNAVLMHMIGLLNR